jgi:Na+-transporting NADH:ubiquinone oxidoreductase subunit F
MKYLATFRTLHKWLGLLVGLQLFLWMFSGMTFSLLSHHGVSGRGLLNPPQSPPMMMPTGNFDEVISRYPKAQSVSLSNLANEPVFLLQMEDTQVILSTETLQPVNLSQTIITNLAKGRYKGDGKLVLVSKEWERSTENRRFKLPVWRADFSGEEQPSLYFDGTNGKFVGIKVDTWRVFDFLWMLHIMDYSERKSFNHPLIILVASLTLFIALSGFLLLFYSFSWQGFGWFGRFKKMPIRIIGKGGFDSEIFVKKHASLYDSLNSVGFELLSECGGGGSCGLCKVKLAQADSPVWGNHSLLTPGELADGYRLACQMRVDSGLVVELPESVLHQQVLECKVISNDFVTPLIKELQVELPFDSGFSFEAGEYVQLHCPPGETILSDIEVPEVYQTVWQTLGITRLRSSRSQMILRAYSLANAPDNGYKLTFNIRLCLPENPSVPVGLASSYLFSLRVDDIIDLSGPFGYFHALDSDREMIFIGGGAGMAPLRSHILHLLRTVKTKRKITFFYGAKAIHDIFYQQEFEDLAREYANFEWTVALSEPGKEDEWDGPVGYIHQVMNDNYLISHKNVKACEFYLCGPPLLNKAVYQLMATLDVPRNQIKFDDFG